MMDAGDPFDDRALMALAMEEAMAAADSGEVPVGALIVLNGKVIARSRNATRSKTSPVRHAEIDAIELAAATLGNERLTGSTLYVTKEPCAMCAGAIIHARIERVVIAARDVKYGACGTVFDVCGNSRMNHVPAIEFGLMEEESSHLLKDFFQARR